MQRILDIENSSFTHLVFGTNGGMGEECDKFISTPANKISSKNAEKYSATITWLRTRLSFEILRSAITCVRGSRVLFRRKLLILSYSTSKVTPRQSEAQEGHFTSIGAGVSAWHPRLPHRFRQAGRHGGGRRRNRFWFGG